MRSFYVEKGNRGLFAIQAELIDDPDGGRYASPEESLSWGRLDLWVQERNLCGPNGATWYLLPVLEWFARNWDALFHESKLPLESRDELSPWERREEATRTLPYLSDDAADRREALWYEWSLRHALRSGAEGGVFPDILLLREGECARFSWGPPPSAGMPAEPVFDHQRGDELLPLKSVCAPLFECMSELTDLMLQKGRAAAIKELPRLLSLRSRLASLRSTPSEERLVWLFGIAHTLDEARSKMTLLKDSLGDSFYAFAMEGLSQNELYLEGSSLGAMMYGSVAPEIGEKDVMLLASRAMSLPRSDVSLPRLPTPNPSWPFLEGYETADHLHDHLKTDIGTPCEIDIEKILRGLGVHIKSVALDDEQIMGVAVLRPGFAPSILINERHEKNKTAQGCRFTLAHELCHLLLDAEHGRPLAVASGPWAPSSLEKRANAFSAMFLMPKPMLETLAAEYSEMKLADVVAERLKTGRLSAELHLRNLGFLP